MRKHLILIAVVMLGVSLNGFTQDVEDKSFDEKKNHFYVSIELLKTLPWLMIDNAYVIEPQLEYRSKSVVFKVQYGMNDIKNTIYDNMEYRNQGSHFKLGVGVDFSYFGNNADRNNAVLGGSLIFASYTETGTVEIENPYFGNPIITQKNDSRGMEVFFMYRRVFENNFFLSITPRIAFVMTNYENTNFPVYYVPGFGTVNVFESSSSNSRATVGVAFKIGYRF